MRSIPSRDKDGYKLMLDSTEISMYTHSPRCYFYEHVLGLRPPTSSDDALENRATLTWGKAVHKFMEDFYGYPMKNPSVAIANALAEYGDEFDFFIDSGHRKIKHRSRGRFELHIEQYLEDEDRIQRDKYLEVLHLEKYWNKPVGGILGYGGKMDMIVRDERDGLVYFVDHKTTKKDVKGTWFYDWHHISPQMTGYYWLGEYVCELLDEGEFGGGFINATRSSPKIEYDYAVVPLTRTDYEIQQFVRNVYLIGSEILDRRRQTFLLQETGQPIENAWPHWSQYAETWCEWKDINSAPDEAVREALLESCTFDPWWERRLTEDED